MLPWRRPEPSPEEEGVLWGHLARVGARRRPAQPSFELVYSLSVCQLFRLSRFVPDFDVSGKTAEPKMAFNFAHLLSAACGGAPRRLGRLRRPWARCARLFWGGYQHRKSACFSCQTSAISAGRQRLSEGHHALPGPPDGAGLLLMDPAEVPNQSEWR